MKPVNILNDHRQRAAEPATDAEYLASKTAKIETSLVQAKHRSGMIPAYEVWDEFGLER